MTQKSKVSQYFRTKIMEVLSMTVQTEWKEKCASEMQDTENE